MQSQEENNPFISVRDLIVEYTSEGQIVHAVNGVSFDIERGKTLGLVGETGAGKTSIAKAIMRILPNPPAKICGGKVYLEGEDILSISESEVRKLRGKKVSMIFQDPMSALNPVKTIVDQIAEVIKIHNKISDAEAAIRAIKMLETVGIAANRANEYPHQFSGGMKQRVIIAMALACRPQLLLADEPTTALDVTIQAQVLDTIAKLKDDFNTAMLMITHDLGVVAEVCDDVAIVYAGQIVEYGSKQDIFDHPLHPYTIGLFGALPDLEHDVRRLSPVEGMPPDPTNLPKGCNFNPRCPYVTQACKDKDIPMKEYSKNHFYRCCNINSQEE